jgi:hypothetical protein
MQGRDAQVQTRRTCDVQIWEVLEGADHARNCDSQLRRFRCFWQASRHLMGSAGLSAWIDVPGNFSGLDGGQQPAWPLVAREALEFDAPITQSVQHALLLELIVGWLAPTASWMSFTMTGPVPASQDLTK